MCSNTLPRPWPGICPCSLSHQASLCCLAQKIGAAFSRYFITLPRCSVKLSHFDLVWAGAMWWHLSVTLLSWGLVCAFSCPGFGKALLQPWDLGAISCQRSGAEAALRPCYSDAELTFNSAGDSILETNFPMQPLARIQLNAIKSNIQRNTCPRWDFKVAH